jgi:hypothetical protein
MFPRKLNTITNGFMDILAIAMFARSAVYDTPDLHGANELVIRESHDKGPWMIVQRQSALAPCRHHRLRCFRLLTPLSDPYMVFGSVNIPCYPPDYGTDLL